MTGFVTFLLIVALIVVVLEFTDRRRKLFVSGSPAADRDRARTATDLLAHRD